MLQKLLSLMRRSVVLGLVLAGSFAPVLCGEAQAADEPKEVLLVEMVVQSIKLLPFKQMDSEKLHIWRWSNQEDVLWIKKCLSEGDQQALKRQMIKREPIGRLEGSDICYATCTRMTDGTFEILCVTPIRLGKEAIYEGELVFSALQLRLDSSGKGKGSIYSFARFSVSQDNVCKIQTCRDPSFRLIGAKALVFTPSPSGP